jgi:hypothetical protein
VSCVSQTSKFVGELVFVGSTLEMTEEAECCECDCDCENGLSVIEAVTSRTLNEGDTFELLLLVTVILLITVGVTGGFSVIFEKGTTL